MRNIPGHTYPSLSPMILIAVLFSHLLYHQNPATPELTLDSAFRFSGDTFRIRQRVTRYIIFDADREVVLSFLIIQVVMRIRMYHTRCRVLRAQSVTPSVNFRSISLSVKQSLYILMKRLTQEKQAPWFCLKRRYVLPFSAIRP